MRKLLLAAATALLCLPPAFGQHIYVRVGPPAPVVEHPGPRPHEGWVWVSGYHRWDGHHYVWVSGSWARPPHRGWVWVPGHWDRDPGGYFWIRGHWARG